jgi:peroxiredoxin
MTVTKEPDPLPEPDIDLQALASVKVVDPEGDNLELGELWSNQRVVLIFLRHFESESAQRQAAEAGQGLKAIRSLGAELYLIGNGTPESAEHFEDEHVSECQLYTDPTGESYRIAGFRREKKTVVGELLHGLKPKDPGGDVRQLGGTMAVVPPGRVLYVYRSKDADDLPPLSEARGALAQAGWSHLAI